MSDLQRALMHGGVEVFELVPTLLREILKTRAWETRTDQSGEPFRSFNDFVSHRRWEGLGTSTDELLLYCKRKEFALVKEAILRELPETATPSEAGAKGGRGNKAADNIRSFGTNPTYTLRRLKRNHPDLAEQVVAGKLSANAAAIKAGWRPDPKDALTILHRAWKRATPDERAAFLAEIVQ